MTHEEFNALYDNGLISVKIYQGMIDKEERTIEAFEWQGKYYLRIHKVLKYTTSRRSNGKKYAMSKESHFIKEFDTATHANNYFKKVSEGQLKRVN